MKASLIFAALTAASTASAYQCPSNSAVNEACRSINVFPLICNNPQVNVEACNAKQCNQPYIDNYSACQCHRSSTMFYEHSANVEGLLRRCGLAGLTNPFGDPNQYKPGLAPTSSAIDLDGTTPTHAAAPIVEPTPVPVPIQNTDHHISGGSIAGIVLGLLAATALAGLLGWCWRKKRHEHMSVYNTYAAYPDAHGPTRTVVTEKVEPVVVRAGHLPGAATATASTSYDTGSSTHLPHTTTTTAPTHLNDHATTPVHPTTSTMGNTAYNTQPRTGADVVPHTVHNANNVNTNTTTTTTTD